MTEAQEPLELRLERIKRLGNLRLEYLQRFYNGLPIAEGYANLRLVLHMHCVARGLVICALYRGSPGNGVQVSDGESQLDRELALEPYEMPVFVWVGQVSESSRPLASVVRLQPLYLCDMRGVDSLEEGLLPSQEAVWRISDRKLCAVFGTSGVVLGEGIDEVIEGCPEIVDNFPRKDAEHAWWSALGRDTPSC